jgi:hypothetical protein
MLTFARSWSRPKTNALSVQSGGKEEGGEGRRAEGERGRERRKSGEGNRGREGEKGDLNIYFNCDLLLELSTDTAKGK